MGTTLDPDGCEPDGESGPEQSGTGRPTEQHRSESVGKSFARGMAGGAGTVLGTALASAAVIGMAAGGVMVETQGGPHQDGGAAVSCTTA